MEKLQREKYESLAREGEDAIKRGDFRSALQLYAGAITVAQKLKDRYLLHMAIANRSLALIELGDSRKAEQGLRQIIMRSSNDKIIYGASYSLAVSLRKQGKYTKAIFFANKALQKSIVLKSTDYQARVHNLFGNIYLFQTYIDKAISEYMKALALRESESPHNIFSMAILKENIGYCFILKKDYTHGLSFIEDALEMASSVGNKRCMCDCYQDTCYAYLQLKNLSTAEKIGKKALRSSIENQYKDIEKNCYYLLGEINFLMGNSTKMDAYFDKLQEFYPNLPFLKEFLKKFDVSEIITLKQ